MSKKWGAPPLLHKIHQLSKPLSDFADVQRGVTPFKLTEEPEHNNSRIAFKGTVRRYKFERGSTLYIRYDKSLAEFKDERYFTGPRILLRELISRQFQLQAMIVDEGFITNKSMQSILMSTDEISLEFILGLLNSKLMSWFFLNRSNIGLRDDFPKIVLRESRSLPIRDITDKNFELDELEAQITNYVKQLLSLSRELELATIPSDKDVLLRQIGTVDQKLDNFVYKLYGLTDSEINTIESYEN